jgi:hypothetical protein
MVLSEKRSAHQDRTKAGFNMLDEFVKAYNGGETYVKRFLTFMDIGW